MDQPYTVYRRGGVAGEFEHIGDSAYAGTLMAALDVEYRENGSVPAEGEEYAVLSEDGKTLELVRVTSTPAGEAF